MQKPIHNLLLAVLCLSLAGCALTPKAVAYKSLNTVGTIVDKAMQTYAVAYKAGTVPEPAHQKITQLHDEQFQPAFERAVLAAKFDTTTTVPPDVSALADQLILEIYKVLNTKTP